MDTDDIFAELTPVRARDMITKFHLELGPKIAMVMVQFNMLDTLQDKFAFIWSLPEAQLCLKSLNLDDIVKSEEVAETHRAKGNSFYKKDKLEDALKCYNVSIATALHPELPINTISDTISDTACSESDIKEYKALACGYANRSAVFLAMKEYKKCLLDIDLALESGYPESLRSKLTQRRERCLNAQNELVRNSTEPETVFVNAKKPPVLAEPSQTIPCFSNAVKLAYSPARGRHVVAARDISPGELLAVEKSYCTFTHVDKVVECCSVCWMQCNNPVPCPHCLEVFCSKACRTKGLKENHGKECNIITALIVLRLLDERPITHMALKILINTPFDELKKKLPSLLRETKVLSPEKLGFDEEGVYNSTDYRSVFHVAAEVQPSLMVIYQKCLLACTLTNILYCSENSFARRIGLPLNPSFQDIIVTGTILAHHMCYHPIHLILTDTRMNFPMKTVSTVGGGGLYPSLLLFKHSCNPTTIHYNIGNVVVVYSTASIPAGKEVTFQYGAHFRKIRLSPRKAELQRLGLTCSCEACENDWPIMPELPLEYTFKCIKCSKPLNVLDSDSTCLTCDINYGKINLEREKNLVDITVPNFDCIGEKEALIAQWMANVIQVIHAEEKFGIARQHIAKEKSVIKADFDALCEYIVLLQKHVQLPIHCYYSAQAFMMLYLFRE